MSILINRIIRASNLARAAKKAQALMEATRLGLIGYIYLIWHIE